MTERVSRLLRSPAGLRRRRLPSAAHPADRAARCSSRSCGRPPTGDPRAERLDAGMSEVDRLSQMVDELLVLSRAGEHEQPGTEVDLAIGRGPGRAMDKGGRRCRRRARAETETASTVWCRRRPRSRARRADRERDPVLARRQLRRGRDRHRPASRSSTRDPGSSRARRRPSSSAFTAGAPGARASRDRARPADRPRAGGAMGRLRDDHEPPDGGARAVIEWSRRRARSTAESVEGVTRLGLRWTLLALLGLAVAAGVSVAASHLVSQRIGLASEPLSAGKELAPPQTQVGKRRPHSGAGDCRGPTYDHTTTSTRHVAPRRRPRRSRRTARPRTSPLRTDSQGSGAEGEEPPDD